MGDVDQKMVQLLQAQIELRTKQAERVRLCESSGLADLDGNIKEMRSRYNELATEICAFMTENGHDNAVVCVGDEQWSIRVSKKNYERAVPRKHLREVLNTVMAHEEAERVYAQICPPQAPEYCVRCKPKAMTRQPAAPLG